MLKLATSHADITPTATVDLSGFLLRQNPAAGVSDPLSVRWLALEDADGRRGLIGAADVLSFSRETFRKLRDEIRDVTGDQDRFIGLATSHTHSAPAVVRLRHCGQKNRAYLQSLKEQVISSARQASSGDFKTVSRVRLGKIGCDVNLNRRHRDKKNPPLDQDLTVLSFEDKNGAPLATIVNYACHPVVLGHENRLVSADYPGALCTAIEKKLGGACLFLNGACGDVNPRDEHHKDPAVAVRVGEQLAIAAIEALHGATEISVENLQWFTRRVKLPTNVPTTLDEIHKRLDRLEERFGVSREIFASRVKRDEQLIATGRYPREITLELSMLALGDDAAILFVPGELFSSIGLRIKEMASPRTMLISGFSNGSVGYLCDRHAYDDGGYEPYFANFFYDFPEFQPSVEDHLFEAVNALLNAASSQAHLVV